MFPQRRSFRDGQLLSGGPFTFGTGGGSSGGSLLPVTTQIGAFGDSQTYGDFRMKSYLFPFAQEMGGICIFPRTTAKGTASAVGANMGVAGQTGAQIASRAATVLSSPATRLYGLMGQNDGAGITANDQKGYWTAFLDGAISANKTIVAIPNSPTQTVLESPTIQARNAEVFNWLRTTAKTTYGERLDVLPDSVWSGIDFLAPGVSYDPGSKVHLTNYGAQLFAKNLAAVERPKFAAGGYADVIAALGLTGNLWTGSFATGGGSAGSGSTGTVGNGLAVTTTGTTGLTVECSLVTLRGKPAQQIDIFGTASTGTIQVQLRETAAIVYDINDVFRGWGDLRLTARDGVSAPQGVLAIGFEPGGGRHPWMSRFSPTTEGNVPFVLDGPFQNLPEENASGGTSINADWAVRFVPGATVDCRFIVADMQVYRQVP